VGLSGDDPATNVCHTPDKAGGPLKLTEKQVGGYADCLHLIRRKLVAAAKEIVDFVNDLLISTLICEYETPMPIDNGSVITTLTAIDRFCWAVHSSSQRITAE